MENRKFFEELTEYRVKVERNGKEVVNIPGILCLPGLLTAPRLSIAGIIAAPLLGLNVHLENENGKSVDMEKEIQKAAASFADAAKETVKTIKEEIDKAWESVSADDPEPEENEEPEAAEETPVQEDQPTQESSGDPEKTEKKDTPTIQINPDDSDQA